MKIKRIVKYTLIVFLCIAIVILSATLIVVKNAIAEVSDVMVDLIHQQNSYCQFYDNDNNLINQNYAVDTYTEIEDINKQTIDAFISIEDKEFYNHNGLNYKRIAKAMINNVVNGAFVEGASTISQQLVKNKYLSNEKTITRKIKEAYLTRKLESFNDKDKIMEAYLNTIYYGNGAYGIKNASQRFFNKEPKDLTLSESCVLAGCIKSPANYSPMNNLELSTKRRNLVLKQMFEDELISEEEYKSACSEDIVLDIQELSVVSGNDLYSRMALKEASQLLNMDESEIINKGYKIYTYQDVGTQEILNDIIGSEKYYPKNSFGNIADSLSMIIDCNSFGISAVAGKSEYDLTVLERQPGSLIKPVLVYAPALENGVIYSCSEILDEKITIDNYSPRNVSDKYYGYVSVGDAIAKSLNIPAVKLCNQLGVEYCKEFAQNAGLKFSKDDVGLAVALGGLTDGFSLQTITSSYIPVINDGKYIKSTYIKSIVSPLNMTIYTNKMTQIPYCTSETAYIMKDLLAKSVKVGTSKKLSNFDFDIAGKTGTVNVKNSNLNTDSYSLAFTSSHLMSVWLGNYTMDSEHNLEGNNNGGTYATEIIRDTFELLYKDNAPNDFEIPKGVVELGIDTKTLEENHIVALAENTPAKFTSLELFSVNNLPKLNSSKFTSISPLEINVSKTRNSIVVSFDAIDYLSYSIYKITDNAKPEFLKSISGVNGDYKFTDINIQSGKTYRYYVVVSSDFTDDTTKSNTVSVTYDKDYSKLLNNNYNIQNSFLW